MPCMCKSMVNVGQRSGYRTGAPLSRSRVSSTVSVAKSFRKMLGFTLPLLIFGAMEGVVAISLLAPSPLSFPGIAICKLTRTQVGQTVVMTISAVLVCLLAAPLYDMFRLHERPEETAGANMERRESEATSQLSLVLTGSCLVTMFVLRKLGLALADLLELQRSTPAADGKTQLHNMGTGKGSALSDDKEL